MKIVAMGGSNSSHSINKRLASYAASLFENATVEVLDVNDYALPIYSDVKEAELGKPEAAQQFIKKIEEADVIVLSLAENNGSYNAGFKNLMDWASRINPKFWGGKPMLLMATSPGARGGATVLEWAKQTLPFLGADVKATFSLPSFQSNFTDEGITDNSLKTELLNQIKNFK